ncbi:MAG: hypothetical protein ABH814_03270, partial [bacterium]
MKHKRMLVFNLGFASARVISGGDVLFMDLVPRLGLALKEAGKLALEVTIVVPEKGMAHWQRQGKLEQVKFRVLRPNLFDRFEGTVAVFGTYIVRSLQALRFRSPYDYYYSCSDVWPDIFPPFILRFFNRPTLWISRIYHIFLTPLKRRGPLVVNLVSVSLQRISWVLMRAKSQKILALNAKLA